MEVFNAPRDSISEALDNFLVPGGLTIEEGMVQGRVFSQIDTQSGKYAPINSDDQTSQSIWTGMYQVKLKRGFGIPEVYCTGTFGRGSQDTEGLCYGETVCVIWIDRSSYKIPIIVKGSALEFYQKVLNGKVTLTDVGERVLRSAISDAPEDTRKKGFPFADNQTDNARIKALASGSYDSNNAKAINRPGGEFFLDKFGRILLNSRHKDHEFMVTVGKTDSGQDDVSAYTTKAAQENYYGNIANDESSPTNAAEPFAPKVMNLVQYQLVNGTVTYQDGTKETIGFLPRFDLWKFQPIVIRKFKADTDGEKISGDVYSVYQLRGNAKDGNAYAFTVTQKGDVKEFVARHENRRIVGDSLISIGGNCNLRIRKSGDSDSAATFDFTAQQDGTATVQSSKSLTVTTANGTSLVAGSHVSEAMALGDSLKKFLDSFFSMVNTWIPIPMDGGAALKAAYTTWYSSIRPSLDVYLSAKNKVN